MIHGPYNIIVLAVTEYDSAGDECKNTKHFAVGLLELS
jgi:hypothetical protein